MESLNPKDAAQAVYNGRDFVKKTLPMLVEQGVIFAVIKIHDFPIILGPS